jgi:predicted amidohydrolase
MDDLSLPTIHQLGSDRGRGNLLGIEPFMVPEDYASEESFFNKLNGYLLTAQREKYLNEKTIVLFPEHVGTWLVLAGERQEVFRAASRAVAERIMVMSHLLQFLSLMLRSKERGRMEAAFFRMKAPEMAEIYQKVFSRLARDYSATMIAGSIILPATQIDGCQLALHEGPLYNTSVMFRSDGTPYPSLIYKAFPTADELPFVTPAAPGDIPSFETAAGRVGVLICADAWFPQAHAVLNAQEIDLLAVPSYSAFGMQKWNELWFGYDGWQTPPDVDANDVGHITEAQAWNKYSLAGRIRSSGAAHGMNVFLRGKLWDQDLGGWSATLVKGDDVLVEAPTQKAAILSLWL